MPTDGRRRTEELEQDTPDLGSLFEDSDATTVAEDAEDSPRETPLVSDDYGVTAREAAHDEPLDRRLRREEPDLSVGHRPIDPERLATTAFPGRIVADDGPHIAEGDTGGFAAEETAVHLLVERSEPSPHKARSHADRLEFLEAQVAVLLTMARIHTEALDILAEALERLPTEEPDEVAGKVSRAARNAHQLLLALREVPR